MTINNEFTNEFDKRKYISKEFIRLISEGNTISSITIKELTDNVTSRSSFYNYFNDVYDLLEWTYNQELFVLFQELLENNMHREGFKFLYKKIFNSKDFYLNIYKHNRKLSVDIYLRDYFIKMFNNFPTTHKVENKWFESNLTKLFYAKSMSYVLTMWLESECEIPVEEILEFSIFARHTTLHSMIKRQNS